MKLNKVDKSYFINLDRRVDRLDHINHNLPFDVDRFSAVDATELELDEETKKLFHRCLDKLTKAEVACSLSHYMLWKQLTEDNSSENYLILEDDVVFKDGFTQFWNQVYSNYLPEDYNLIYLGGCQPWNKPHYGKALMSHNEYFCTIKKNDFFTKGDHFWHMTTCSYLISKKAAKSLCLHAEQFGINNAVDIFILRFLPHQYIYHLNPLMAYQLHEEGGNAEPDAKSDIRHSNDKFGDPLIPKIIHQTWRSDSVKDDLKNTYLDKNQGYEYCFYGDLDIDKIIQENFEYRVYTCYKRLICGSAKADFFRYCILYLKGGIYCDIDLVPLVSFDSFITEGLELVTCDDQYGLYNAFLASKSRNNFFLTLIYKICDNIEAGLFRDGGFNIFKLCGPTILYNHFNDFYKNNTLRPDSILTLCHNLSIDGQDFIEFNGQKIISCQNQLDCQKEQLTKSEHYSNIKYLYSKHEPITKIIHQSWKTNDIPYNTYKKDWIDSWLKKNPDWDYKLWTDEDNRNLIKNHYPEYLDLYDSYEVGVSRADIARYFYMHKYGGVYVDLDFKCLKPLNQLLIGETMVLGSIQMPKTGGLIDENSIPNAFKYSKPNQKFWLDCIELLPKYKNYSNGDPAPPEFSTGPIFLSRCLNQLKPKGMKILDPEILYPINWATHGSAFRDTIKEEWYVNSEKCFPNSYAVTFWSCSWRQTASKDTNNIKPAISKDLKSKRESFMQLASMWPNFLHKPKNHTEKSLPVVDWLTYCDKNISHPQPDKSQFSCYNGGKDIAIVMMYTPNIYDFAVYSEKSIKQYAEHQGYTLYVYRDNLNKSQHPNWSKPQALLNHIGGHSHIVWMDSDTLIFNPEKKFSDIIDQHSRKYIIACKDIGGENGSLFNSGVLIFKNHQYIKNLITKWRDFNCDKSSLYSSGGDQEVLCNIVKRSDSVGFNRKILPSSAFNTDPRLVDKDTFILHFMAYPATLKRVFMSYWHSK